MTRCLDEMTVDKMPLDKWAVDKRFYAKWLDKMFFNWNGFWPDALNKMTGDETHLDKIIVDMMFLHEMTVDKISQNDCRYFVFN